MKNTFKHILTLMLAVVMVAAMMVPAYAVSGSTSNNGGSEGTVGHVVKRTTGSGLSFTYTISGFASRVEGLTFGVKDDTVIIVTPLKGKTYALGIEMTPYIGLRFWDDAPEGTLHNVDDSETYVLNNSGELVKVDYIDTKTVANDPQFTLEDGKQYEVHIKFNGKARVEFLAGGIAPDVGGLESCFQFVPVDSDESSGSPFHPAIKTDAYYYPALVWAYNNDILENHEYATGIVSFSGAVIRSSMYRRLYYAFGRPEITITADEIPFEDLKYWYESDPDIYCGDAWAYQEGIGKGISSTEFGVWDQCTRGQAMTIFWRACGEPSVSTGNKFIDVADGSYYETAVNWAVSIGVTNGTSENTFSPDGPCTQVQLITMIYRYMQAIGKA